MWHNEDHNDNHASTKQRTIVRCLQKFTLAYRKKTETRQLSKLPKHLKVQRSFLYVLLEVRMARSKHVSRERERERETALGSYMWPQQNVSPAVR